MWVTWVECMESGTVLGEPLMCIPGAQAARPGPAPLLSLASLFPYADCTLDFFHTPEPRAGSLAARPRVERILLLCCLTSLPGVEHVAPE